MATVSHRQIKIALASCYLMPIIYVLQGIIYLVIPNIEQNILQNIVYDILYATLHIIILNSLKIIFGKILNQPKFVKYFIWIINLIIVYTFTDIFSEVIKEFYLAQITYLLIIITGIIYLILFIKIIRLKHYRKELFYLRLFAYTIIMIGFVNGLFNVFETLGYLNPIPLRIMDCVAYFLYFGEVIPGLFLILQYHRFNTEFKNINNASG